MATRIVARASSVAVVESDSSIVSIMFLGSARRPGKLKAIPGKSPGCDGGRPGISSGERGMTGGLEDVVPGDEQRCQQSQERRGQAHDQRFRDPVLLDQDGA